MRKSSKNTRTAENVIFGCDAEYKASKSKDGKSPAALKTTSSSICHFFLHNRLRKDQPRPWDTLLATPTFFSQGLRFKQHNQSFVVWLGPHTGFVCHLKGACQSSKGVVKQWKILFVQTCYSTLWKLGSVSACSTYTKHSSTHVKLQLCNNLLGAWCTNILHCNPICFPKEGLI